LPSPSALFTLSLHDALPISAFRSRGFRFFTTGNLLSILGRQMLAVAVEWEIYQRTHSATALGLVGLVFAIPIVGLNCEDEPHQRSEEHTSELQSRSDLVCRL